MPKEYLSENNSRTVRLSNALITTLEDINNSLEINTINDLLNEVMRPVAHGLRKARSRSKNKGSKWNVSFDLSVEKTVTISFSEKVKE